jgi:hypothetical protein
MFRSHDFISYMISDLRDIMCSAVTHTLIVIMCDEHKHHMFIFQLLNEKNIFKPKTHENI